MPAATQLFEERTARLRELSRSSRRPRTSWCGRSTGWTSASASCRSAAVEARATSAAVAGKLVDVGSDVSGVAVLAERVDVPDAKELLALSDRVRQTLGESAVVLGCAVEGRVHLVANVAPAVVERGVKAGDVVRAAAEVVGRRRWRARHYGSGRGTGPRKARRRARNRPRDDRARSLLRAGGD